ncbi:unnamed protein product, partial [Cyprideis torosa]
DESIKEVKEGSEPVNFPESVNEEKPLSKDPTENIDLRVIVSKPNDDGNQDQVTDESIKEVKEGSEPVNFPESVNEEKPLSEDPTENIDLRAPADPTLGGFYLKRLDKPDDDETLDEVEQVVQTAKEDMVKSETETFGQRPILDEALKEADNVPSGSNTEVIEEQLARSDVSYPMMLALNPSSVTPGSSFVMEDEMETKTTLDQFYSYSQEVTLPKDGNLEKIRLSLEVDPIVLPTESGFSETGLKDIEIFLNIKVRVKRPEGDSE